MRPDIDPNAARPPSGDGDHPRVTVVDEVAVIECTGELAGEAVVALERAVTDAASSCRSLLIDVSSVTRLDSTAVATVVGVAKGVATSSDRVVFECPPSAPRETLADLGLDRWLPLESTRAAARARLRAGASPR